MSTADKIRIGVVFGGRSSEHEVSLVSAQSIMKALDKQKYEVIPIGIAKSGSWLVGMDPQQMLPETTDVRVATLSTVCDAPTGLVGDPTHRGLVLLDQQGQGRNRVALDVLFPILHGTYGEDGTIQGLLELADIPYVGCGVLASSIGMDKTAAKRMFRDVGLPVVPFLEIRRRDWRLNQAEIVAMIEQTFTYPCFVKPVNSGSSVGVSKVHQRSGLIQAMDLASRHDRKILVEAAIDAREIEVSVLGNDAPITSLPGEIVPCNEFYDYQAKYVDNRSTLKIPADLDQATIAELQRIAAEAFKVIDGAGMARVDFFLDRNTGAIYLNEVNTIPGFTSISMYPKLWEASGIPYPELVDRLVELALERYADKQESLKALAA